MGESCFRCKAQFEPLTTGVAYSESVAVLERHEKAGEARKPAGLEEFSPTTKPRRIPCKGFPCREFGQCQKRVGHLFSLTRRTSPAGAKDAWLFPLDRPAPSSETHQRVAGSGHARYQPIPHCPVHTPVPIGRPRPARPTPGALELRGVDRAGGPWRRSNESQRQHDRIRPPSG